MIAALLLLTMQGGASLTCGPADVRVSVTDGWIDVRSGSDELAEHVRVRIWGPWVHETGCAELDGDSQEELFVVSRTTGTGPYYRIQILDFERRGDGPESARGVHSWSYGSEGRPRIEGGRVLLGTIPVDRWDSKGPATYRAHGLTRDGLVLESSNDCQELAPSLKTGASSEPVVTLSLELFETGDRASVEIITSLGEGEDGAATGDDCSMAVTVRDSGRQALGATTRLPVSYCDGVGLWSARAWRLAHGGALAALEFGAMRTRYAASDLHIVYLGRNGGVWRLALFPEIGGYWSGPSGATRAEAGARLFEMGSSTILAVDGRAEDEPEWLELSTRRDELRPLPDERARACAPEGSG